MLGLFQHLSPSDIQCIPCMVHVLHLTVCTGLGIWEEIPNCYNGDSIEFTNNKSEDDFDECLSHSVRTMTISGADNTQIQPDNENQAAEQEEQEETRSGDEVSVIYLRTKFELRKIISSLSI